MLILCNVALVDSEREQTYSKLSDQVCLQCGWYFGPLFFIFWQELVCSLATQTFNFLPHLG